MELWIPLFKKEEGKYLSNFYECILNKEELEFWHKESIHVQEETCEYNFNNYEEVQYVLFASEGKILIHSAMRCSEKKVKDRLWEGKEIV